jgi:hypothetical protein
MMRPFAKPAALDAMSNLHLGPDQDQPLPMRGQTQGQGWGSDRPGCHPMGPSGKAKPAAHGHWRGATTTTTHARYDEAICSLPTQSTSKRNDAYEYESVTHLCNK